jgi:nucleoside-diphosphate-sugar epimerase
MNHASSRKILVVGAAGVIGRQLLPLLVEAGHDVTGTTRVEAKTGLITRLGARPVVVDVYDRAALIAAVQAEQPEIIINQLTDLSEMNLAANARIRTVGARNLIDAAQAAGVRRMIAQSIAFAFAPGEGLAGEDAPLDLDAPKARRETALGVQALESAVSELPDGLVLRYGLLYGPGTGYAADGKTAATIRRGERPATGNVTSWLHVVDAAKSTIDALEWPSGIVNLVDDEPASELVWMPVYAERISAPPPRIAPASDRPTRGASNAKAHQLGWKPLYPSWREGFNTALG